MVAPQYITFLRLCTQVLIYIANDIEYATFVNFLSEKSIKTIQVSIQNEEYLFFKYESYYIATLKGGDIGSFNYGAAVSKLSKINVFSNLKYVVSLGCCCSREKPGTVLVSSEIVNADFTKINNRIVVERGNHFYNYKIANNFSVKFSELKSFCKDHNFDINYGQFLCVSSVINKSCAIRKIWKRFPNAVALEMEGCPIAAFSNNFQNFLIIKGCSDHGKHKNGSAGQEEATKNATKVLFEILQKETILKLDRIPVFISGALPEDEKNKIDCSKFCHDLALKLLKNNFKIINGYGLTIGPSLINGCCDYILNNCVESNLLSDVISLSPFPLPMYEGQDVSPYQQLIREQMAEKAPITIVIYGKKKNAPIPSDGMKAEFNMCLNNNHILLPVGYTGFAAKVFYDELVKKEYVLGFDFCDDFSNLNNDSCIDSLLNILLNLHKKIFQ